MLFTLRWSRGLICLYSAYEPGCAWNTGVKTNIFTNYTYGQLASPRDNTLVLPPLGVITSHAPGSRFVWSPVIKPRCLFTWSLRQRLLPVYMYVHGNKWFDSCLTESINNYWHGDVIKICHYSQLLFFFFYCSAVFSTSFICIKNLLLYL